MKALTAPRPSTVVRRPVNHRLCELEMAHALALKGDGPALTAQDYAEMQRMEEEALAEFLEEQQREALSEQDVDALAEQRGEGRLLPVGRDQPSRLSP